MVERFVVATRFDDARQVLCELLLPNLPAIDVEACARTFTRLCPTVHSVDLFCSELLTPLIAGIENLTLSKHLAVVTFDFALTILRLRTIEAPSLCYRLLQRPDFYPWKEWMSPLTDLLHLCASYETIVSTEYFTPLNELGKIVELIADQARVYPAISQNLHGVATDCIVRWSDQRNTWSRCVYLMGSAMFHLIDQRQVDERLCLNMIHALQQKMSDDGDALTDDNIAFCMDLSKHLGSGIQHLPSVSHDVHSQLATMLQSALQRPIYDAKGAMTFACVILANTIFRIAPIVANERDARLYEPCLRRMYARAKEESNETLYEFWFSTWLLMGTRLPEFAADHIDQFLEYTCHRQQMELMSLLTVSELRCRQTTSSLLGYFLDAVRTIFGSISEPF